jgi:hypothetical protein
MVSTILRAIALHESMGVRRNTLFVVSLLALLAGCSDDDRLPTYQVTGKVVFSDGTPLKGGWIIFECPERGLAARGVIEIDGTYRLGTYEESDGAVAGKQLVAITPALPDGYDPDQGPEPAMIHRRFTHMDTSGLKFEVTPDGTNHIEITVERH